MPKNVRTWVRATANCWTASGEYVQAGTEFEYDGPPHDSLTPIEGPGKSAKTQPEAEK